LKGNFFFSFVMYVIQHSFICRPSGSTVSEDAGIEPRTAATLTLTENGCNNSARSHPHHSARSHLYFNCRSKILTLPVLAQKVLTPFNIYLWCLHLHPSQHHNAGGPVTYSTQPSTATTSSNSIAAPSPATATASNQAQY
jgi:hypothetical protein